MCYMIPPFLPPSQRPPAAERHSRPERVSQRRRPANEATLRMFRDRIVNPFGLCPAAVGGGGEPLQIDSAASLPR